VLSPLQDLNESQNYAADALSGTTTCGSAQPSIFASVKLHSISTVKVCDPEFRFALRGRRK
jgi:hypothetical protein